MSNFPNTRWTTVVNPAALSGDANACAGANEALNALCQVYWFPIYSYARSWGKTHHQAEDLTQTFFQELVEGQWVARADRSQTKFRTFLLTHFKYVLSNEHRMQQAEKRGAQFEHLPIDFEGADEHFQALAGDSSDPTAAYDRAWAEQVVDQTLRLLDREYSENNPTLPFDALRPYLPGGAALARFSYEDLEARHGVKMEAIRQRVSRLNKRFRELLVGIVADTVSDPAQVDEELKSLVAAMVA
ncbi:MAG TPA: hypothetical protein VI136_00420 [Verrucomicrobiae bacterium]